ncbi:MAG TPA: M23 family metallopeptidase [Pseudomonadales bacterium]|nr:M23 family metallopeptidase [Pseudomonadales bacterium]
MKFIIVDNRSGKSRSFAASGWILGLAIAGLVGIPVAAAWLSYRTGMGDAAMVTDMVGKWRHVLKDQGREVADAQRDAEANLEASALKLAQLQARITRLDALGARLTNMANLDQGEFDFSQPPGLGGPESATEGAPYSPPDYMQQLSKLSKDIESREQQLSVLETLLVNRKIKDDRFVAGRPVEKGWISSRFGMRIDPFNGRREFHPGIDFAGKLGTKVYAVAAGVVVFAGKYAGYGKMVEINHGGGFVTRYGHHEKLLVKAGDIVKKGQVIGLMGSTGRSTGPHVHFEVYKNGRVVDPSAYIHRASR